MDIPQFNFNIDQYNGQESSFSMMFHLTDDFEQNWTPDRTPDIEEILCMGAKLNQIELFTRLLEIDILSGKKANSLLPEQNYLDRFPQFRQIIRKTWKELTSLDFLEEEEQTIPKQIDHYRIDELLGKGGMGAVYRGTDLRLQRPVAIKFMSQHLCHSKEAFQRFREELANQGQLDCDHIVRAYSCREFERIPYLIMEYVDGINLEGYLLHHPQHRLSEEEAVKIVLQAARGLHHLHSHRIMHRDIKPGNIICRHRDGMIKICDIGLGVLFDDSKEPDSEALELGKPSLIGTAGYMPPEATHDPAVFSPESDIYGLGMTFFFLLSGISPLALGAPSSSELNELNLNESNLNELELNENKTPEAKIAYHKQAKSIFSEYRINTTPKQMTSFFRERNIPIPDRKILALIHDMTLYDQRKRIQSAETVIQELERWRHDKKVQKLIKRWLGWSSVAAALVSGLIAVVSWSFSHRPVLEVQKIQEVQKTAKTDREPSLSILQTPSANSTVIPIPLSLSQSFTNELGMTFQPVHHASVSSEIERVTLNLSETFYLNQYETTVNDFRKFVDATGYRTTAEIMKSKGIQKMPDYGQPQDNTDNEADNNAETLELSFTWANPGFEQTERDPVVCVSYTDALAFVAWLNRNGPVEVVPNVFMRYALPTRNQWILGYKQGKQETYHWGSSPNADPGYFNGFDQSALKQTVPTREKWRIEYAFHFDDGYPRTAPVGSFKSTGFGLYDMHGNVREWVGSNDSPDWQEVQSKMDSFPMELWDKDLELESVGGGFLSGYKFRVSSKKFLKHPCFFSHTIGFRVALILDKSNESKKTSD